VELKLPLSVVGRADLARLSRLLETRDNLFISAGAQAAKAPATNSDQPLEDLAHLNGVDLQNRQQSQQLKLKLEAELKNLPLLHVSFAVEPSSKVVESLLGWLRQNIHPGTLMSIGLQPSIAAGCVIRTPNRVFDLSLRNRIKEQDAYLIQLIKGAVGGK